MVNGEFTTRGSGTKLRAKYSPPTYRGQAAVRRQFAVVRRQFAAVRRHRRNDFVLNLVPLTTKDC